ncbi:Hypothetical protein LUCI_0821 [Lucifera butyrica]|uniref:Uncharacterized protein n=1 Tax=Lucifera butyrica TaxID=1351585 RepID=A0A498R2J2_9FIRM|nr:hypothetical protein [Lucifera butyrica]VBB05611.1 Hypothetical protein LUCI_0821 [Lucifera butyrica]
MKKVIILLLFILALTNSFAFAEVNKTLSDNYIGLERTYEYTINGTNKHAYVTLSRQGFFDSLLGITKTNTSHSLYLSLFTPPNTNQSAVTDITFSTKNLPCFVTYNGETQKTYPLKVKSISTNYVGFKVDNSTLLPMVNAEKIGVVLTLKDGSTQKIEIPEDVLKDWKFIVTCNLLDEYKKGL